jgi:hypothetical protein
VCNATLDEYHRGITTDTGVLVIKVAKHKTGKYGSAKLTVDEAMASRIDDYVHYMRPLCLDPLVGDPGTMFILPGSKPVHKWSNINGQI